MPSKNLVHWAQGSWSERRHVTTYKRFKMFMVIWAKGRVHTNNKDRKKNISKTESFQIIPSVNQKKIFLHYFRFYSCVNAAFWILKSWSWWAPHFRGNSEIRSENGDCDIIFRVSWRLRPSITSILVRNWFIGCS